MVGLVTNGEIVWKLGHVSRRYWVGKCLQLIFGTFAVVFHICHCLSMYLLNLSLFFCQNISVSHVDDALLFPYVPRISSWFFLDGDVQPIGGYVISPWFLREKNIHHQNKMLKPPSPNSQYFLKPLPHRPRGAERCNRCWLGHRHGHGRGVVETEAAGPGHPALFDVLGWEPHLKMFQSELAWLIPGWWCFRLLVTNMMWTKNQNTKLE